MGRLYNFIPWRFCSYLFFFGVPKHRTGSTVRTGPQNRFWYSVMQALQHSQQRRFEVVVLSAAGRFRWCGLRPWLGALLTVSVPLVDSAYSAESAH